MAMPIDRQSARPVRIIDETNYGLSRVPFDFSTLLFLGLGTRLATLPFLGMIAVIQTFVYQNAWIEHLV